MNPRIKELHKQAFDLVQYQLQTVGSDHPVMQNEQLEMVNQKFAELIVQECIEQGSILTKHYIDTRPEQEQVMLLASIADYSNEIKKHFGIEE